MEPENTNQTPVFTPNIQPTPVQQEPIKPQVEEPAVIVDWKKPLISMIIVGVLALGLMMLVKYL
jgi:hypothetical protein